MSKTTTLKGVASEAVKADGLEIPTSEEAIAQEGLETREKPILERDVLMKEMVAKRSRQHQGLEAVPKSDQDIGEEEVIPPVDVKGEEIPPVVETPPVETPPAEQMVDIVVDGQTIQRTQAQVDEAGGTASIQKQLAGDFRLKEASERNKQVDEREREVDRKTIALQKEMTEFKDLIEQQKVKGVQGDQQSKDDLKAKAKEITEKFFEGDSEQLQGAVEELLKLGQQPKTPAAAAEVPAINEEQIARKAADYVRAATEQTEAVEDFRENHPDLNGVKGRRDYVDSKTVEVMEQHPTWGPAKVIEEAVKQTRVDLNLPAPSEAPPSEVDTTLEDRRTTKRKAVDVVPVASERVPKPQEPKPKTQAEIFKQMQAGRSHTA